MWVDRAPRLAIAMWQAASASVVVSTLLSAFAVAVPAPVVGHGLAGLFEACAALLGDEATLSSASTRVGLAVGGLVLARVVYTGGAVLLGARRERRTGRVPAFALGAGGETALTRVRRMLHPQAPLDRRERLAGLFTVTALLAGPTVLAAAPGVGAFLAHHCHSFLIVL